MQGISTTEADQTRAAVVGFITEQLQPLYRTQRLDGTLSAWVAKIPTPTLAACLKQAATATAEALARVLLADTAPRVVDDLAFIAECEFPHRTVAERTRLARFAATMRDLAIDGDGTAKTPDLYAAGYTSTEVARMRPDAHILISRLIAGARPDRSTTNAETSPAQRLALAGARAAGLDAAP